MDWVLLIFYDNFIDELGVGLKIKIGLFLILITLFLFNEVNALDKTSGKSEKITITNDKGKKLTGFAAALESACKADEEGLRTQHSDSNGRSSGSRLTAKLWGIEWLWRYYQMSNKGVWDAFAYRMIKGAKKELSDTGPFIKILGEQGRTKAQQRLRMQQLIDENDDFEPIYDKNLENKPNRHKLYQILLNHR